MCMFISKARNLATYEVSLLKSQVNRAMHNYLTRNLEKYGLTPADWPLLGTLYDKGPLQPSEIAQHLQVKPPVVTAALRKLEGRKIIKKTQHTRDSRAATVTLTVKGKNTVEKAEESIQQDFASFTKGMKGSEIKTYLKVLRQFGEKLSS